MNQNSTVVEKKRFSFVWTAFLGLILGAFLALGAYQLEGKEVTLIVDGVSITHITRAQTVAGLLAELQIPLQELEQVQPGLEEVITAGAEVRLSKGTKEETLPARAAGAESQFEVKYVTEHKSIPYKVIKKPSSQVLKGEETIAVPGKEGLLRQTRKLVYHADELIADYLVVEKVLTEPIDQVVLIGTKEPPKTVATQSGTYRYKEVKTMLATAYYPGPESTAPFDDGYTATGLEAGYGIVAVDPRVIPLGSKVFIPGYGVAIAGDVGGAIKGDRVDLCYETLQEALEFGKKWVEVYVLE